MYEAQLFEGQVSFLKALEQDFDLCFKVIMENGFQTGWKKITGKPQHGNFNPNYKDCLDFLQKAIVTGLSLNNVCPDMPIANGLNIDRNDYTQEDFWFHMYEVALLYKECVKDNKRAKRDGTVRARYNEMVVA